MPPTLSTRRARHSPAAVLAFVVVLLAAACGPSTTSSSPSTTAAPSPTATNASPAPSTSASSSGDPAVDAIYDAIEAQVVAIRGLQPKRPVDRQFIDRTELRALLTQEFDADTPASVLEASERFYKALGLIPETTNLRTLNLDLLSGGVAAFYRDDESKLYVVSKTGQPGAAERFYFSHEYDHALQDQNSTIFKDFHNVLDQSDQLFARQAIYEGDATLLMTQWAAANLSQAELLEILSASADPAPQAALAAAPPFLREGLTFPYTIGFGYVSNVQATGGWPAVNAYFTKMPTSTEQILHPEKYTAGEAPIAVTFPADLATRLGSGWTVPTQDTLGEFQIGIWLRESGVTSATATAAAAGWGGDRAAVIEGPGGAWAVAIDTAWDTAADADQFETAATTAKAKATGTVGVLPGAGGTTRWFLVASDASTLQRVAGALGLAG